MADTLVMPYNSGRRRPSDGKNVLQTCFKADRKRTRETTRVLTVSHSVTTGGKGDLHILEN